MIKYTDSLEGINVDMLQGFFVGWRREVSQDEHLRLLQGSYKIWLAVDEDTNCVVGFVNAVSDGVLSAFIPLLEVLSSHHGQGVGKELMQRILQSLDGMYMIDAICDNDKVSFYENAGMTKGGNAMLKRNWAI
ncbi:MAG: GNAT family N-acetyltransferase [Defluviitaleaceae bacterium]|nr:GNAT family N-acetyltransferase [Defluviitaleaceae bacterium]